MSPIQAKFIFARHGESVVNVAHTISNGDADHNPLTELGRGQAQTLLTNLRDRNVTQIYSSTLSRASETAGILAAGLGLEVQLTAALKEPYCGIIEGRNDQEAWTAHAEQEKQWAMGNHGYRIQGGESYSDVRARFIPFVEQVVASHRNGSGTVIFVSHGSVLINMLSHLLTNVDADFAHGHPMLNCAYVTTVATDMGLKCLEWCGKPVS